MSTPDPDDFRERLLREADRVSAMSPEDQAAWLQQLRELFAARPDCEKIVQLMSSYMTTHQAAVRIRATESSLKDQLEAQILEGLENAILHGVEAFETRASYAKFASEVALLGHILPHVKARLAKADAQDFLWNAYKDLFM